MRNGTPGIRPSEGKADVQTKAIAQPMQRAAHDHFRCRVFAADARHVPASLLAREFVQTAFHCCDDFIGSIHKPKHLTEANEDHKGGEGW